MFAKATPLLSQTQNQEQSHCRNRHGSRCEPAQGVGNMVIHLIFYNTAIVSDKHNHQEQRRCNYPVQGIFD
jgi:hypothetical protein